MNPSVPETGEKRRGRWEGLERLNSADVDPGPIRRAGGVGDYHVSHEVEDEGSQGFASDKGAELILVLLGMESWKSWYVQTGVVGWYFHVHVLDLVTPTCVARRCGETKRPPHSAQECPSCTTWLIFVTLL